MSAKGDCGLSESTMRSAYSETPRRAWVWAFAGVGGCLISDLQSTPRRIASVIPNPSATRMSHLSLARGRRAPKFYVSYRLPLPLPPLIHRKYLNSMRIIIHVWKVPMNAPPIRFEIGVDSGERPADISGMAPFATVAL